MIYEMSQDGEKIVFVGTGINKLDKHFIEILSESADVLQTDEGIVILMRDRVRESGVVEVMTPEKMKEIEYSYLPEHLKHAQETRAKRTKRTKRTDKH